MRSTIRILVIFAILLTGGVERTGHAANNGYRFGLAITLGEGMYFIDSEVYRQPVSLEVVPSLGWVWFKFDLGLSSTLESVGIPGSTAGYWAFTFRPGGRVTPPMIPLYFRFAFPLQAQVDNFDWGMMIGLGVDIHILGILGLVFELDTILSDYLGWGSAGLPLELRAGVSLHF